MGGGVCLTYRAWNFYRTFDVYTRILTFKLVGLMEYVQQNSVNLMGMGTDRCQMIKYSELSDSSYTAMSSHR